MATPGPPERQKSDRQSLGEESPNSAGQGASEEEDPAGRRGWQVQQKVNIQSAVWRMGNR